MSSVNQVLEVYQDLADWYEQRGQAQLRDRFLVLAADAALTAGRADEAERLRARLLQQNPHHLLKPYASLAEAIKVPAVQDYVADLRRSYAPEVAEQQLQSLRANAEVVPPREVAPPPPRPAPPPPKPRSPEPPPKDTPDVQLFYPIKEDLNDPIPHTMPLPRKRATGEPLFKPMAPPPPAAPVRAPTAESSPTPRPAARIPSRPPAVSPFITQPLAEPAVKATHSDHDQEDLATGYWISTILFVLLLLAGLALAGYTLLRPFLPKEWVQ
jgi:hypothetical protein